MSDIMGLSLSAVARDADTLVVEKMKYETELDFLIAIRTRQGLASYKLIRKEFPGTSTPLRLLDKRVGYLSARLKNSEDCYKIQRLIDILFTAVDVVSIRAPMTVESPCEDLATYKESALRVIQNPASGAESLVTRFKMMAQRLQQRRLAYVHLQSPEENLEHLEKIIAPVARAVFANARAMLLGSEKFTRAERTLLAELCVHKVPHFDFRTRYRFPPPGQLYLPAP